jgi:hypothetical protein
MFVTVDPQTVFRKESGGMFMVYLLTKTHIPRCNNLLITAIKPKVKKNVHTAAIFFMLECTETASV